MSFQPVVPLDGYVGWRFLQRTLDRQQVAYSESAPVQRATDYFREKIASVQTAEDLVNDRRLLSVALGAFGLDDDINNTFFIRKVLQDGIAGDDALANRLADKRYFAFSLAFGLGDGAVPRTALTFFADDIIGRYEDKQFARAVGEQNDDMRLALNVDSGLSDILRDNSSDTAQWFSVMGNAPLRQVFETALGLPPSFGQIDLDQQLGIFRERALSILGTNSLTEIATPEKQEDLIRLFLVRSQAANFAALSGGSVALTLLSNVAAQAQG